MSQPTEVYPNNSPLPISQSNHSSNSNGSFGPVFVVLAVIVVISAVACVLERLCNRRKFRAGKEARSEAAHHHSKGKKQKNHGLPKEWESKQEPRFNMRDGDIEFGFDKKIPSAKSGGKQMQPPPNGGGRRPEVRFADDA